MTVYGPVGRFLGFTFLSVMYTLLVVRNKPPGLVRLLSCIPVLLYFFLAPMPFEQASAAGGLGFLLSWVANFKLLAFSAGRGPLSLPGLDAARFAAMMLIPFYTSKGHSRATTASLATSLSFKVPFTATLTAVLLSPWGSEMPSILKHFFYALYIWMFVSLLLDSLVPLGIHIFHTPLQPSMNQPYLSRSIKDFWGSRYNLIVSCLLYDTIYLPIIQGSWINPELRQGNKKWGGQPSAALAAKENGVQEPAVAAVVIAATATKSATTGAPVGRSVGSHKPQHSSGKTGRPLHSGVQRYSTRAGPVRRFVALYCAFAVSGIMHELCIWYMCRKLSGRGKMLGFFLLQPLLIAGEGWAKRGLPKSVSSMQIFRLGEVVLTVGIILVSAELLFWEPLEACQVDKRGLTEMMGLMQLAKEWVLNTTGP